MGVLAGFKPPNWLSNHLDTTTMNHAAISSRSGEIVASVDTTPSQPAPLTSSVWNSRQNHISLIIRLDAAERGNAEAWTTTAEPLSQLYHSPRHQRASTGADS